MPLPDPLKVRPADYFGISFGSADLWTTMRSTPSSFG